ncbi:MAG: peptidoglycan DD-metalloendopeptidase family protein [Firmicutes bacterium]|nr:peptidoglycan DD-metalloendopeptidase family protein [Bacillota bacterium]
MKHGVRFIAFVLIMILALSFWTAGLGFASNSNQSKLDEINDKIDDAEKDLAAGKKESKSLASEIEKLERQIKNKEKELDNIQGNISSTRSQIGTTQTEMQVVQEQMTEQNANMNERLRTMYKNGNTGMLEVLLGSEDLSSLVTNIDMVSRIYDSDTEVLKTMQETYNTLEQHKKKLEELNASLKSQEASAKAKQDEMEAEQDVINKKKKEVDKDNKELEKMIDEFQAEADALVKEIQGLQSTGTKYTGGKMTWPAPGYSRITSEYGNRIHPVLKTKKFHAGMDIGVPSGNKIVAAAGGTVIKAAYSGSYGNMVMIDHGGGIVTLYAHNTKLLVKKGDKVSAGQQIAVSGATGRVTGPHLHFEVRVNGNYVNPRNYL